MNTTATTAAPTPRQRQLIDTIREMTAANGYRPTMREVARRWGCHWTLVHKLCRQARAKGLLTHDPRRPRSWRPVE
jgi:SOS-response transcriptional repressor LexA